MRELRCVLAVLLWTASAFTAAAAQKTQAPRTGTAPAAARLATADHDLEAAIRARLAKSKISTNRFQVHVQGGVATLEGRTGVIQHKGTATRLARAAGAKQVVNRIEVSEAARQRAAANLAKGRRRVQVKRGEPRSEKSAR